MNIMQPTVLAYRTLNAPFDNYAITEDGKLYRKEHYSMKKTKMTKAGVKNEFNKHFTERPIRPHKNKKSGYHQVSIRKTGFNEKIGFTKYIHELVAEQFIGLRPEGYQVDHIDGNRSNNHCANLEYVTRSENIKRMWKRKLAKEESFRM